MGFSPLLGKEAPGVVSRYQCLNHAGFYPASWAVSSAVERSPHTRKVIGSKPIPPTRRGNSEVSVHSDLVSLVRLQELDRALDDVSAERAKIPLEEARIAADLHLWEKKLSDAKTSLVEAQVQRKNFELDVDAQDQAVRKASGELGNVKSNEAYKALLSQIDDAKKKKTVLEDQILIWMETIESLQRDLKVQEKALQEDKAQLESRRAALVQEADRLKSEESRRQADRGAFVATLPTALVARYDRIRRGRPHFQVMALIKKNNCGGCRTTLPHSVVNDVMKGKELHACETCSRIFYILPEEPKPLEEASQGDSLSPGPHASEPISPAAPTDLITPALGLLDAPSQERIAPPIASKAPTPSAISS